MTSRPVAAQHLRDLARLRRVRDRIGRDYAQPLDVEALARGAQTRPIRNREAPGHRAVPSVTAVTSPPRL